MTISGWTPISSAIGGTAPSSPTTVADSRMGKDTFLKLLVAQLKYQDPTSPTDSTAFLAQTAQFTQVEKLEELVKDQRNLLSAQLMVSAGGMVGKTITYPGPDGQDHTGVVTSATFTGSTPTLRVGDTDVPLSSVKEVHA